MTDLNEIGKKINDVVKMVKDKFDKAELESFIDYTRKTEAMAPFIALQQWGELPSNAIEEARKRARLLLEIKELKDSCYEKLNEVINATDKRRNQK